MKKRIWSVTNYGISIYPLCLLGDVLYYDFHKLTGKNYFPGIMEFKDGVNRVAVSPASRDVIANIIIPKIVNDKNWVKIIIQKIYATSDRLLAQTGEVFKMDLSKKTNKQLLGFYQQYNQKYKTMYLYGWLANAAEGETNLFSKKLEQVLLTKLARIGKTSKIGEYFSILVSLPKDSDRDKEQKAFLRLLIKAKDQKNLNQIFFAHQARYCWLQYDYNGPALPISYFVDQAKSLLKNKINPTQELKKIVESRQALIKKQRQFEKELGLTPSEKYLFWLARQFSFIKNYRKDVLYKSYYQNDRLLQEIGRRLNLSINQVKYILPFEMAAALLDQKYNPALLNQRSKYSVVVFGRQQLKVLVGAAAKKIIRQEIRLKKIKNQPSELAGQVAYSGHAEGIVKIVNLVQDLKDFKLGNILVSEKTNPNLIPAMKKAAAIITDAGGLTCHAAIVSRELKKPCIVGTKIATQVFKDGDQVKVDGGRGIITKLS